MNESDKDDDDNRNEDDDNHCEDDDHGDAYDDDDWRSNWEGDLVLNDLDE